MRLEWLRQQLRELGMDKSRTLLVMLGVLDNPDLQPIAEDARERLERVVAALGEG